MVDINISGLKKSVVGAKIPKPVSGTLSGHAAGEPFDKFVYARLQKMHPGKVYRQYEYLNSLYQKNSHAITLGERKKLFASPTALFMLSRGESATKKWKEDNLFEEKQDDTADILISEGNDYLLIDVKTRNISKTALAPNIISSYKLAWMCKYMIDNKEFDVLKLNYIEIDWELQGKYLVCLDAHYAELFKENPDNLYINWAAAMQIQFHVSDLEQGYKKNLENWAKDYLRYFNDEYKKYRREFLTERKMKIETELAFLN